jgi:hypothetical protein
MSISKYKFVSPGVFVNEIDNSQLPALAPAMGPVIVGRTERGPSMRPIKVNSFSEYIELFGETVPGGRGGDVWREGNYTSPMYATYAAQAWLRNGQTATVIRLLGTQNTNHTNGEAGWGSYTRYEAHGGGSYGLFLIDSGSATNELTGTLAAVWYFPDDYAIQLSGTLRNTATQVTGNATLISEGAEISDGVAHEYTALITSGGITQKEVKFNFDSDSPRFVRKVFNTNPVMTNSTMVSGDNLEQYWLAHSFEGAVESAQAAHPPTGSDSFGIILGLGKLDADAGITDDWSNFKMSAVPAKSGWVISQDTRGATYAGFDAENTAGGHVVKLFQFHSLDLGEWANKNIKISISNIKAPANADVDPFGSFDVLVRRARDMDNSIQIVEQYNNCNLNPHSPNYISRRIGDTYATWDDTERRFRVYGDYVNTSKFVRVEVNTEVDLASYLPFGFWGPYRPKAFAIHSPESVDAAKATATITVDDAGGPVTGETFTIVNSAGTTTTFTINGGGAYGTQTEEAAGGTVTVMIGGAGGGAPGKVNIAAAINAKINLLTGDPDYSSVTDGTDTVTVTQTSTGASGNQTNADSVAGITVGSFTGGRHGPGGSEGGAFATTGTREDGTGWTRTFATSSALTGALDAHVSGGINVGTIDFATSSFIYPSIRLRYDSTDSLLPNDKAAYFGFDTRLSGTFRYDPSSADILSVLPSNQALGDYVERSLVFTLDDVKVSDVGVATYVSGSRISGDSATADSGSHEEVLDRGFNKFTVPMWGGFDGWDVTEFDPVANKNLTGVTEKTSYAYNTVRRAIDACSDPEQVDYNLLVAPGITEDTLTDLMINVCEERGDAMAIVDLKGVYSSQAETTTPDEFSSFTQRVGTVDGTVSDYKARKKNTSYGCTYYPWVQIRDSLNNAVVWVPPSVVALGTFASSDRVGELWFAPAGFNRGGLSQGSSGLSVTNISERLTSEQRDKLYEVNINPIASFPNEGIVIFGQKTMDATTSALSRINVRRLLIYLKKEVSRLANQVLFDQNVKATWGRFKGLVNPFLENVKVRFGLTDYKLVLDETTTTPDLIDRNIMYAKIFLKPARAIEYIALDFIITRTGASFDD